MRYAILLTIAVLILPASSGAQNVGFPAGIRNPPAELPQTGGVGVGLPFFPVPGDGYGYIYPNGTVIFPSPTAALIGRSLVPGRAAAQRHPTRTPSHPVAPPLVIPSPLTGYRVPAATHTERRPVRIIIRNGQNKNGQNGVATGSN